MGGGSIRSGLHACAYVHKNKFFNFKRKIIFVKSNQSQVKTHQGIHAESRVN